MLNLSLFDITAMKVNNPTDYNALIEVPSYRQAVLRVFQVSSADNSNTSASSKPKSIVIARLTAGMLESNATLIRQTLELDITNLSEDLSEKTLILNKGTPYNRQTGAINKMFEDLNSFLLIEPQKDRDSYLNNLTKLMVDLSYEEMKSLTGQALSVLSAAGSDISKEQAVNLTGQFVSMNGKVINTGLPTYTGVDMRIIVMTPHIITELLTATTLTYSLHSSVIPVKTLGRSSPKGFAYGDRTIAGTIIGVISRQDTFIDMQPGIYTGDTDSIKSVHDLYRPYLMPDQLPLMDFILTFQNEYGDASAMSIFGVKLTDMGQVFSMSDSVLEVQYTYTALDIQMLRATRSVKTDAKGNVIGSEIEVNNNEYLMMRNRVLNGMTMNRSPFEVMSMYNAMTDVLKDMDYITQKRTTLEKQGLSARQIARTDIAGIK